MYYSLVKYRALCVILHIYSSQPVSGSWSSAGCEVIKQEQTPDISVCQCDHMTSFAVLHDVSDVEVSDITFIDE